MDTVAEHRRLFKSALPSASIPRNISNASTGSFSNTSLLQACRHPPAEVDRSGQSTIDWSRRHGQLSVAKNVPHPDPNLFYGPLRAGQIVALVRVLAISALSEPAHLSEFYSVARPHRHRPPFGHLHPVMHAPESRRLIVQGLQEMRNSPAGARRTLRLDGSRSAEARWRMPWSTRR